MEIFFENEYYHIYVRGKNKENIFLEENDYLRMMALINNCNKIDSDSLSRILRKNNIKELSAYKENQTSFLEMHSFTIMPNHLHLMFKSLSPKFTGHFMRRILTSYAKYFNLKYSNIGHVFESKYKFEHVNTQEYFDILLSYIRNNPIKLLDKKYKHIDLINGVYKIPSEVDIFIKNYPYSWQRPTLPDSTMSFIS